MLPDEQIQRALAYIASLKTPAGQFEDDLIALAADHERQREEVERLRDQVEYLLQRNGVLEEVNNNLRYVKDHAEAERERLKAQLASIKDHADEYLVNEDLTAEKAMRLIGRKLS